MDAQEWLPSYRERLSEIKARADAARRALSGLEGTAATRDGAVTVTVAPTGALRRLVLTERAEQLSRTQLAEAVLETARRAHAHVARDVQDVLAPLVGASEAGRHLRARPPQEVAG